MREGEEERMEGLGEEVRKEGGEGRGREGRGGGGGEVERGRKEEEEEEEAPACLSVGVETMRGDDNK